MNARCWAVLALVASPAWGAEPASAPDAPRDLDPMTVTPMPDPFEDARERLRQRFEETPCLGCDAPLRKSTIQSLLDVVLLKAEPPNPDLQARQEQRVREDWRHAERGPEMEAFR